MNTQEQDTLEAALLDWYRARGELPVYAEALADDSLPHPDKVAGAWGGSYPEALRIIAEANDLESAYRRPTERTPWTRESIPQALLAYYRKYGEFPSLTEARCRRDLPGQRTMKHHLGDWATVIAGIARREGLQSIYLRPGGPAGGAQVVFTKERVDDALASFIERHGRVPTLRECRDDPAMPHAEMIGNFYRNVAHGVRSVARARGLGPLTTRRGPGRRPAPPLSGRSPAAPQVEPEFASRARRIEFGPGLDAERFMKAYATCEGRFTPTVALLRRRGVAITNERARTIAEGLWRDHGEVYRAWWPAPPVLLEGNTRPGDFDRKLGLLRMWAEENGDVRPPKRYRPEGVFLYQWLKNLELKRTRGNMPEAELAALRSLPGGTERFALAG